MKVAINGLIIDKNKAGIGHYGYKLINSLINNGDVDYTIFIQKSVEINYSNVCNRNDFKKSFKRIIEEQLVLPFKYNDCDLVHFIDYSSPILSISKPFITTIHDLSFYKYPDTFLWGSRKIKNILTPLSIKRSAKIIADSENTKEDILNYFPDAKGKVCVIYPGKPSYERVEDEKSIESVKMKYNIKDKYILFVGSLEPRKNLINLIKAFNTIADEVKDLKLVIVGKIGWLYDRIFDELKYSNNRDRIVITGYVPDEYMPYIYSGAEALVYPSFYEGFGLPPLEAMCCGTPVIVSNISSLPEVVGNAGVYCNPNNIKSIADAIISVVNDKNMQESLKLKGLKQSQKFNWSKTADMVIETYREILQV